MAVWWAFLRNAMQGIEVGGPAVVVGQRLAFLIDEAAELFNAQFGHEEFDAGAVAVALFAKPSKDR